MQQALELAERHASILKDWFGRDCVRNLISAGDQVWFLKSKSKAEKKRDLLASHLAAGWLNVAEARDLTADEFRALQHLELLPASPLNAEGTYLVRFALDYDVKALAIRNPDVALAHELVFSLWVRRRDAHAFNRVYKDGVPIFFDFGTAFLGERRLVDLKKFFRRGPDPGWAGWWRLFPWRATGKDTYLLRQMENVSFKTDRPSVLIPVESYEAFFDGLRQCERKIAALAGDHILCGLEMAEFSRSQQQEIHTFLMDARDKLPVGVEMLRSILLDW
jgi:hypothetical protein